jgi:hypothetical protein
LIHDSNAKVLFCRAIKCGGDRVIDTHHQVSGYSVFDHDTQDDEVKFSFDNLIEEKDCMFVLHALTKDDIAVDDDAYQQFLQEYSGVSVVKVLCDVLTRVVKRYQGFETVENFDMLLQNLKKLKRVTSSNHPCVSTSSEILKVILAFQEMCSLRITFIEGNHRHVCYISQLLKMTVKSSQLSDYFLREQNQHSITFGYKDKLMLQYKIYVAQKDVNATTVINDACGLSNTSNEQHRNSVSGEKVHE